MIISKNNILVITDSIDVNDSSASKGRVALINNLVKIGYHITVLHYTRKNIELDGVKCISIPEKKYNFLFVLSRLQRLTQRLFKVDLSKYTEPFFGFSFTFFNDVNSIKAELKKIDISKIDFILTLSKGGSFRPHYAINKLPKFHSKWIAYIHDPFPFSKYPFPYNWKEPGYKIKESFFQEVAANATHSIFPSLLLKHWMVNVIEHFNETGIVIPHQNFELNFNETNKPDYFDGNKFNLLHAGSLMMPRNPEGLLKGFQLFLKNTPSAIEDVRLLLVGSASYHKDIIISYDKLIPELYTNLKNLPFTEVYWLQKHVSVNIIIEANAEVSPFLPGKFPHCIMANKPILYLGPKKSEVLRLLGDDYPYHTSIDNAEEIAKQIACLYKLWKGNKSNQKLNRKDLEEYISASFLEKQMINVL